MRTLRIDVHVHATTDLLLATSEDMVGLHAHGRSLEELRRNTAHAVAALCEAQEGAGVAVHGDQDPGAAAPFFLLHVRAVGA